MHENTNAKNLNAKKIPMKEIQILKKTNTDKYEMQNKTQCQNNPNAKINQHQENLGAQKRLAGDDGG